MSDAKVVNQPEVIIHDGIPYYLDSPLKELGNGVTEGPFYVTSPFKYTPDQTFLTGQSSTPLVMHKIQTHPFR